MQPRRRASGTDVVAFPDWLPLLPRGGPLLCSIAVQDFPVISEAIAATVGEPPAPLPNYYDVRATKGQQERHTFPEISKALVLPRSDAQATPAEAAHVRELRRSYGPRTTVGEKERRELFPEICAALATCDDDPPSLTPAVVALKQSYDALRSTGDTDRQTFPEISDVLLARA